MKKEQKNYKKELQELTSAQLRSIKGGDEESAACVLDNGSGMIKEG